MKTCGKPAIWKYEAAEPGYFGAVWKEPGDKIHLCRACDNTMRMIAADTAPRP